MGLPPTRSRFTHCTDTDLLDFSFLIFCTSPSESFFVETLCTSALDVRQNVQPKSMYVTTGLYVENLSWRGNLFREQHEIMRSN